MIPISPEIGVAMAMLAALTAYALSGGADFGAGVWNLLARGPRAEAQRKVISHAIGPIWETNHVWLIIVIVLLFTGFPTAFVAIMTALHVPVSLMLVGIVLRGSAFIFRSYDDSAQGHRLWNGVFSMTSVITPILLGTIIGAIATGRVESKPDRVANLFSTWIGPFPFVVGLFTLAIFSFLAAVYLTLETKDPELVDIFRKKSLIAAGAVGILAYGVYLLARRESPIVFHGLDVSGWGLPVRFATGVCAILALACLWIRWFHAARIAAIGQVTLIVWGCALAQNPYLVPPDLTIENSAASPLIHKILLLALGLGSLILFPSIYYLYHIFKGHEPQALTVASEHVSVKK